eukprot:1059573-Rhodomonas_salina.1
MSPAPASSSSSGSVFMTSRLCRKTSPSSVRCLMPATASHLSTVSASTCRHSSSNSTWFTRRGSGFRVVQSRGCRDFE